MHIKRTITLRVAIAAAIWASALLAPAAAAPSAYPMASLATLIAYNGDGLYGGSAAPGPTDPNNPSS